MKIFGNRSKREAEKPSKTSKKKGKGGKKKSKIKILIIVLAVLAAITLGLYTAYMLYVRPPAPPTKPPVVSPQSMEQTSSAPDTEPEFDPSIISPPPDPDGDFKEGFYTILLAGTDEDDFHSDVLMVASIDTVNQKVNVVSIPRDTMVNVKRTTKKVNAAYGIGKMQTQDKSKQAEMGANQLKREVKTIIGFQPSYYAIVKYEGFINLVDSIGGVEYDVPVRMRDKWDTFDIPAGLKKLTGAEALNLCRYRGYTSSDFGRIQTVQNFMRVVFNQIVTPANIPKIPEFVDIISKNLSSDLDLGNMIWFAQKIADIPGGASGENFSFHQIPVTVGKYKGQDYVFAQKSGTIELINKTINPYTEPIKSSNVDIINLSNVGSGSSSSGNNSAKATPKPASKATPTPTPKPSAASTKKPGDNSQASSDAGENNESTGNNAPDASAPPHSASPAAEPSSKPQQTSEPEKPAATPEPQPVTPPPAAPPAPPAGPETMPDVLG